MSSSFDESVYGFRSFGSFLGRMDGVVRVVPAPATGGDLRVYPASAPTTSPVEADDDATRLVRKAKLSTMRYEANAQRRRALLSRLFAAMAEQERPFTLGEVHASMQEQDAAGAFPFGDVVKYARTLYLGGVLVAEDGQDDVFFRDRRMSLTLDPPTAESLILAYETAVATRLVSAAGEEPIDAATVSGVLDWTGRCRMI